MTTLARLKFIWKDMNIRIKHKIRLMRALVITIFLYACETWTLTAELQRRIQSLEFRCFRKILGISYKDRITNEQVLAENHHKANRTIRRSPGNCKAAKTEMVRARDKIGRPNQSDITGNSRRQSKKGQAENELDRQHRGVDRQILR